MGGVFENIPGGTGFGNDAFLQNDDLVGHLLDNPEVMADEHAGDAGFFLDSLK